jgi:hypothetical protein
LAKSLAQLIASVHHKLDVSLLMEGRHLPSVVIYFKVIVQGQSIAAATMYVKDSLFASTKITSLKR